MTNMSQRLLHDITTGTIVRMIQEYAPISRTDIVERSGLAASTVSTITSELQTTGLIRACGHAKSSGGRRPILLELNPDGGYFIGIEFVASKIVICVMDLSSKLVQVSETALDLYDAPFDQLVTAIHLVENWCQHRGYLIRGIGLGVTGLIDSDSGIVVESSNLKMMKAFPIRERLANTFHYPITLENEANAATYGEYIHGNRPSLSNMMYIAVGEGIGCGIILNGQLFKGTFGMAGEIGHVQVAPTGCVCRCGKTGCLESIASGWAISRDYALRTGEREKVNPSEVIDRAENGHSIAADIVCKAAYAIGTAIGNQFNVLNIDTVVLGGELIQDRGLMFEVVAKAIHAAVLPSLRSSLDVRLSSLGANAAAVGAAYLSLANLF